jgi:predicted transcriptional regulator of viral defense system
MYNMSMVVNKSASPLDQIRKIMNDQNGILLTSDLAKFNISRTYLSLLVKEGEIERISRGVYSVATSIEDEMFAFQARYKTPIYSHETALFLHDLTDRTPLTYSITVPVGYHSISLRKSGHKIFYVNRNLFDLGVISLKSPYGNDIKTTDLERTICDLLRSRNQMDIQMVNDSLKKYVRSKKMNLPRLYTYAKQFGIQKIIRQNIEILL